MLRAALDVLDAIAAQQALKLGLAAPCGVLPPVVGEHLAGRAVGGDPALQRLQDQRRALMVRHGVADDETAVIVHEDGHVQPLVASQQKGEDVTLPELIRLRPLEAARRMLSAPGRRYLLDEPLLVQDASDQRFAHPDALVAGEFVADATRPVVRVRLLRLLHRPALRRVGSLAPLLRLRPLAHRHQPVASVRLVADHPAAERPRCDPHRPGHLRDLAPAAQHRLDCLDTEVQRVRLPVPPVDVSALGGLPCLAFLARLLRRGSLLDHHPVSPFR